MPLYVMPHYSDKAGRERAIAFLNANGIVPRDVVSGAEFFVEPDELGGGEIVTTEFVRGGWDGKSRVRHDGCCGSDHFAKHSVRHPLKAQPEDFGFTSVEVG